jgi:hypothetical protein
MFENVFIYLQYQDEMNFIFFFSIFTLFMSFSCYLFQDKIEINHQPIKNI